MRNGLACILNVMVLSVMVFGVIVTLGLAARANAQPSETVGVVTEIKPGRGRVEVKPAAGGDWRPAAPLLGLRRGDTRAGLR